MKLILCADLYLSDQYLSTLYNISIQYCKSNLCDKEFFFYPKSCSKTVLQIGGDAHEQRLPAGDHGHSGGEVSHHVVGSHAHVRLLGIQGEVLPDDLLAGGHGDLDGPVNHGVHQLLYGTLNSRSHALLQLRVGLQQWDLYTNRIVLINMILMRIEL